MDKNILMVASSLASGVIDKSVIDAAVILASRGFGMTVVSAGGKMVKELKKQGIEHVLMPVNSSDWFVERANVKRLTEIIAAKDIRLIHAFTPASAKLAFKAGRAARVPYIASFMRIYKQTFLNRLFGRAKYMTLGEFTIVPSEYMAAYVQSTFKVAPEKIIIVPQWIDTGVFNEMGVSAERIISVASSMRIPEDHFIAATLSHISRAREHQTLLQAVARLPENKRARLRVLIVGECKKSVKTELERQAARLGIDNLIHIAGEIHDLPALLMLSDVYVSTSAEPEAAHVRLLEAQSLGRPVIAAGVGSAPEYALDPAASRLFDPKSPDSLAEALSWAMDISKDERFELSRRLSAAVRLNFSRANLPAKIGNIYDYMLGEKK
ncbi:MAG: glycosyltransferase [Rickettsiales bacterium]|nr:glycosyltransferase [Rickettsiales bacterium]